MAVFLPRIRQLNARDVRLYAEARAIYDARKTQRHEAAVAASPAAH